MNMGMIGALGGLGTSLTNQSAFLAKAEEEERAEGRDIRKETRADVRQRNFQDWLLKKQQEYKIEDETRAERREIDREGRTDTREEARKDRDYDRTIKEAPGRATATATSNSIIHDAKSGDAARTADQDAGVKKKLTEAGQTDSARDLQGAQADYYRQRPTGSEKLSGADSEEIKGLRSAIADRRKMIDQGRIDGTWDDEKLTPAQRKIQTQLIADEKRLRTVLQSARGSDAAPSGGAGADPLNLRKPAAPAAPSSSSKPGMVGGGTLPKGVADSDMTAIYQQEYRKAQSALASAKTPEERARAEGDIAALQREAKAKNVVLEGGGAPAAATTVAAPAPQPLATAKAPAAPAAPAQPARPDPLKALLNPNASATASPEGGAATPASTKPAATTTASKVESLRAKVTGAAAPQGDPVLRAMGAGGNSAIDKIVAERGAPLKQAAAAVQAAQAEVVQAANSQNPQAVQAAVAKVAQAAAQLDGLLKDMMPAQAMQVKKALGIQTHAQ